MKISKSSLWTIFTMCLFLSFPRPVLSQLVLGQYEDEAPLQTWNTFGITTASSMGRGGTSFTLADSSAVSFSNPALLTKLPPFTLAFSGSHRTTAMNKYGIVNTGVYRTRENSAFGMYSGDYTGVSFNTRGWALSLSIGAWEYYRRPDIKWDYSFAGQLYYTLLYNQSGVLLNTNFSIARQIFEGFALGLGFNLIHGKYEKQVEEQWPLLYQTISDDKSFDFTGFFINGGIVFDLSAKLTLAAVVRSPYKRNADSASLFRFLDSSAETDIQIDSVEKSVYHQPLMIGVGFQSVILPKLTLAADASFFNWSNYEVNYFGETLRRDFKDVLRLNAGLEFLQRYFLFNTIMNVPLRAGLIYDPQPMSSPNSTYICYTLGAGFYFRNIHVDLGFISGREYGSGFDLAFDRIFVTFNYSIGQTI